MLREALKIPRVEEQLRVAAVWDLVIHNLGTNRSSGVQPTLAEGLLTKLGAPQRLPAPRLVPTASTLASGSLVYQGRAACVLFESRAAFSLS